MQENKSIVHARKLPPILAERRGGRDFPLRAGHCVSLRAWRGVQHKQGLEVGPAFEQPPVAEVRASPLA